MWNNLADSTNCVTSSWLCQYPRFAVLHDGDEVHCKELEICFVERGICLVATLYSLAAAFQRVMLL